MSLKVFVQVPMTILQNPFQWRNCCTGYRQSLKEPQVLSSHLKEDHYVIGQYTFDPLNQLLSIGSQQIKLTTKESELLELLCRHSNDILERNFALKSIWIDDNYFNARSMDVYITRLRKYLKKDPSVRVLNVHGKGYKLII